MKDELLNVYNERLPDLLHIQETFKDDDISAALLMSPNEKYAKQPVRLMIVGQETYGWGAEDPEKCEYMMAMYEDFDLARIHPYKKAPFWSMTRKLEAALGNDHYSCAWTNISKYDQACGRPDKAHEAVFSTVDNLLVDEIRIVKPKVCVFFISYLFDYRLKNIFNEIEFIKVDGFEEKVLCQVKHPNLPELTFRTYHPRYLRMNYLEEPVIEFIAGQAKK
jgi:hypothetical protein